MPSLNIKDYIIAGLLLAILGMGATLSYFKTQLSLKTDIISQQEELAEAQKEKIAIIEKSSQKTTEYLNEKYDVSISLLNSTIDRMHNEREESLMPSIPETTRDPSTACFSREELNEAVARYRAGVQELIIKGSEATIGLNIAKEWVKEEAEIYDIE